MLVLFGAIPLKVTKPYHSHCKREQLGLCVKDLIMLKTIGADLISDLKWQTLDQITDYYLTTLMYNCVQGLTL